MDRSIDTRTPSGRDMAIRLAVAAQDEAIMAAQQARGNRLIRCRECGQEGFSGSYPFSTLAASGTCDDCL